MWGQSLIENLHDVIYAADADGTVTYVSPAIERLLGYTPAELVGGSLGQTVHDDDLARLEEALQGLLEGETATNEYRILTKSGQVRWIRTSSRPSIQDGRITGVQGVLSDITERKLAEEQLREQNEFLTLVLESLTHPFYVVDAHDYSIHIANSAARAEALGKQATCYALAHHRTEPCSGTDHPCPLQEIKRSREPFTVEHVHYSAAGEPRIVQVRGYPLFDPEGNVDRIIEYTLDITEQREAEEALRESEVRWRSVAQNSPDHVIILDTDLRIEFLNRAAPGLTVKEVTGTPIHNYLEEKDHKRVQGILEGVLRTAEPNRYETTFTTPDGGTIYYDSRVVPRVVDGQVVGLTVNARDITAYKQTEKVLREAKEAADKAQREERARRWEADRRRRVAESLAGVLAALNSDLDVAQILDYIAVQAREILDSQAVFIYSLHDPEGILDVQATQGLADPDGGEVQEVFGQEALEQAVATRRPAILPEVPPSAEGPYRAVLAVPILIKDEVYGGMGLYYGQPQDFSPDQVGLATIFGDQVALTVENARLRKESEQAAAAAERNRLARDLHDSVTQALFSASLVAEVLPQVWQRDPEEAQEGLQELRLLTRGALAEMRTMLLELRPTALLETKLDDLLWQVTEAITSRVQLISTCNIEPVPPLPPDVHVTFYRVAQEALHNVVKHAAASHVVVGLRASPPMPAEGADGWQGQAILHVSDDGRGFEPSHTQPDHMGLSIMRERAAGIGAALNVVSEPERGTQITLVWHTPRNA
jgi:two-component system nitrate/nitrite sensor histidine kinase NarX